MTNTNFKSFIGIDLHKTTLTVGCLDPDKNIRGVQAIDTKCVDKIVDYVTSFPRPIACSIESVGMFEWLWELLEDKVDYLVLADATEVKRRRQRGKAKTDRNDSLLVARLLLLDELPKSYVPNKTYRTLRKLGRHYHVLSQQMADIKTRMRWILNQNNARGPQNLDSKGAQRWLLAHAERLDDSSMLAFSQFLLQVEHMEVAKASVIRRMNLIAKEEEFKEDFKLLRGVKGFGPVISFIVLAEIADFSRFKKSDCIASYTGLTEKTNESAGNRKTGHISRCGNATLRWALVEATTTLIREDQTYKALHERLMKNMGGPNGGNKHKAKVAVAQKLIRRVWKMMLTREPFRSGESTDHQIKLNEARLAKKKGA